MNIRDPVHGQMEFSDLERKIIDLPQMQRLRQIKQVGLTYLVYPGAHHTRFEHSMGTAHLASIMGLKVGLEEDEIKQLRLAALLHDVGHMPFSHDSEEILAPLLGNHEKVGANLICKSEIADVLGANYSPAKISGFAFGGGIGQLITCGVGADRLDYLLRDAHYTGVAYGVIDWGRILAKLIYKTNRVQVQKGGLEAAESTILARFSMFHTIYYHHAVRIARKMMQKALLIALESGEIDTPSILEMGDNSLMSKLGGIRGCREYVLALENRKLLKRAQVFYWNKLDSKQKKYVESGKFEAELKKKFPCTMVDMPSHFMADANVLIYDGKKTMKLSEISSISYSLEAAAAERANLIVISPYGDCEQVARAAKRLL